MSSTQLRKSHIVVATVNLNRSIPSSNEIEIPSNRNRRFENWLTGVLQMFSVCLEYLLTTSDRMLFML